MDQTKATPYKTEQDKPETKYSINEEGDVVIVQTISTTSWWKSREFLSLVRTNEAALENTRKHYSEDFIEKLKNQEQEIIKEIELMTPVMEEAERIAKEKYEKQRHDGLKSSLIAMIDSEKPNYQWWNTIWMRAKDEIRDPIIAELSKEQKVKYQELVDNNK